MIWLYIVLAFLISLIIGHFVTIYFIFLKFFHRISTKRIDKEMKDNDYAAPFLEEMYAYRKEMEQVPFQERSIASFDNLTLTARWYDLKSDKTVIMCHGFHANPFNNFAYQMKYFLAHNYNVLLINQRAHTGSEGRFSTYGQKEARDVLAWIDFMNRNPRVKAIYVYGISMGATAIAYASENIFNNKVKCLIMESSFTSVTTLTSHVLESQHVPSFLFSGGVRFLSRHLAGVTWEHNSTTRSLKNNQVPSIFVHGTKDSIAITSFFEDNYNNCSSKKYQIIVEDAPHALCALKDKEKYLDKLESIMGELYE